MLLFSFSAKTPRSICGPQFPIFTAWKDTPGAAAFLSLVRGAQGEQTLGECGDTSKSLGGKKPPKTKKKQLEAVLPPPCSKISKLKSWTTIQLHLKNTSLFCIPESVRPASSGWPRSATAATATDTTDSGQGLGRLCPGTLDELLGALRARMSVPLGASTPICHFKAAACRPCLPSARGMQWGRKNKMLGSWEVGTKRKKERGKH